MNLRLIALLIPLTLNFAAPAAFAQDLEGDSPVTAPEAAQVPPASDLNDAVDQLSKEQTAPPPPPSHRMPPPRGAVSDTPAVKPPKPEHYDQAKPFAKAHKAPKRKAVKVAKKAKTKKGGKAAKKKKKS